MLSKSDMSKCSNELYLLKHLYCYINIITIQKQKQTHQKTYMFIENIFLFQTLNRLILFIFLISYHIF